VQKIGRLESRKTAGKLHPVNVIAVALKNNTEFGPENFD
jgi:hypothetical protein